MKTIKKAFIIFLCGLLSIVFSSDALSRDKKIKYGKTGQVIYVGEVENKVPSGNGSITVKSVYKQYADILMGTFNCPVSVESGTIEGEILFPSNYVFKGLIEYALHPSYVNYTLSKGSITMDAGETYILDEDEILHFTRKYGSESFEMSMPDKENLMWNYIRFTSTDLYTQRGAWYVFSDIMKNLQKHIDDADNYRVRFPHRIVFVRPDKWELQKRDFVENEVYYLMGEDDFKVLAISGNPGGTDRIIYLVENDDLSDLLLIHFSDIYLPVEYYHRFGNEWDNYVFIRKDDDIPRIREDFPGYRNLPYKYQKQLETANPVSITYADGSTYAGSVLCHGNGNLQNADWDLISYLLFGVKDIHDIEYNTGVSTSGDGTKQYFIGGGSYSEWKEAVDAEIAAENERIARENEAKREREEAELRAKREKEEAEYNAECKKYGKKYVDKARNYQLEIGMPEELFLKYFGPKRTVREGLAFGTWTLHRVYTSNRRTQYRLDLEVVAPFTSDDSVEEWIFIWFENGKMTSFNSSI